MYLQEVVLKIKPVFENYLEKSGFVLVDIRFFKRGYGSELVLEILADRKEGGITVGECSRINRGLGSILEVSEYAQENYVLDVSSPGLDRPLVTASDFNRKINKRIRIFLKEAVEDRIEYEGIIQSVEESKIIIKTEKKTIVIPLDKVNKAKQII